MMFSFACHLFMNIMWQFFNSMWNCQNIVLKCAWGAGIAVRQVLTVLIVNDKNDKHDKT